MVGLVGLVVVDLLPRGCGGSCASIPHICHERHEYIRVNFVLAGVIF